MYDTATAMAWLADLALILPVIFVSFTVHEFAHAITATWCGDDTPYLQGRVTLNPMAHVDLVGLLCLIFFHIGWAKPVQFNPDNFKHHKLYSTLTAVAGPISNFMLALVCMYLFQLLPAFHLSVALHKTLAQILRTFIWMNIGLGVLNFLPVPPLDGSHLLMAFLRERAPQIAGAIAQYSFYIMIALLLLLPAIGIFVSAVSSVVFGLLSMLVFI